MPASGEVGSLLGSVAEANQRSAAVAGDRLPLNPRDGWHARPA